MRSGLTPPWPFVPTISAPNYTSALTFSLVRRTAILSALMDQTIEIEAFPRTDVGRTRVCSGPAKSAGRLPVISVIGDV